MLELIRLSKCLVIRGDGFRRSPKVIHYNAAIVPCHRIRGVKGNCLAHPIRRLGMLIESGKIIAFIDKLAALQIRMK